MVCITCLIANVWVKLTPHKLSPVPIMDGSTILISEQGIDSMFHKTVVIDLLYGNTTNKEHFNTDIKLFGRAGGCNDIFGTDLEYDKPDKFYLTEKTIAKFPPIYALKGSTFDFRFASYSGNSSVSAISAKYTNICLFSGTSYNQGDRVKCREGLMREAFGHFKTKNAGYFFFKVEPDSGLQYSLNVTSSIKTLQYDNKDSCNCSMNADNSNCSIELPLKSKFCLMAKFYRTAVAMTDIKLKINVKDGRFGVILVPSLLVPVAFLVTLIACFVLMFCCKFRNSRLSMVTIV